MFVITCTRSDIAFAMGKLSRYTCNMGSTHWHIMRRVLKYLKTTIDYGSHYSGYPPILEGFSYASWIINSEHYSSTSWWVYTLGGVAISWGSKKQTSIADSIMAAEFVAL